VGAKGDLADHLLSFDASIYYISWKDIQLQLRDPISQNVYYSNGSRSKSQGIELALEARPVQGLKWSGWVAVNEAKLTEPLPAAATAVGAEGDRLPNTSHFSANTSAELTVPVSDSLRAFAAVSLSYVGNREGIFLPTSVRQVYPAYARTDMRAGLKYDSWSVNLFANNVTDRRAILAGGLGSLNPAAFYLIQPRTTGISVSKTF
jgi:iron complex outermembrane receptor protein